MEATRRNHPTIDDMRLLPIGQVIDLPAEHLALLQEEARSLSTSPSGRWTGSRAPSR